MVVFRDTIVKDLDKEPEYNAMMGDLSNQILESNPRLVDRFRWSHVKAEDSISQLISSSNGEEFLIKFGDKLFPCEDGFGGKFVIPLFGFLVEGEGKES